MLHNHKNPVRDYEGSQCESVSNGINPVRDCEGSQHGPISNGMIKIFGTLFILSALFAGTSVLAGFHAGTPCTSGGVSGVWSTDGRCITSGGGVGGTPSTGGGVGGTPTQAPTQVSVKLTNPITVDTFDALVAKVIDAAVTILMPFVVLAFIYSGFLFVKAQGKAEEITEAKTAIWWSIIGAFILLGAWGFAQIIGRTVSTITS